MIRSLIAIGTVTLAGAASAQTTVSPVTPLALTNATYTQRFDTLAQSGTSSALPAGFQIAETGTSNVADGQYAAGTGSANAGNVYSFGAAGSGERALGSVFSGSNSPSFGAVFTNRLGTAITALSLEFFGEQWRAADATSDRLRFEYRVGGSDILGSGWTNFVPLDVLSTVNAAAIAGAIDGNANRTRYAGTFGVAVGVGQNFAIRWIDLDGPGGADHGLAIDDLTLVATVASGAVPEPATWGLMILGFGAIGAILRRRTRSVPAFA